MPTATVDEPALDIVLRNDFAAFQWKVFETLCPGQEFLPNWHIHAMNYQLEHSRQGYITRLIINLPPRSLKSLCVSVAYVAWCMGHDPTHKVICVSYSEELARKHSRDFRTVVESPWYRRLFPPMRIDSRKNTETEISTTAQGYRLATSIGGTLTGRGGNLIIIDDPLKSSDAASETARNNVNEWYSTTLLSRLDDKLRGRIIVVMHRLHENDLTGHVLANDETDRWATLCLPAIATQSANIPISERQYHHRVAGDPLHIARESAGTLEGIRRGIGTANFEAQYQQTPIPPGGNLFNREWLRSYDAVPPLNKIRMIVQSWDTAGKTGAAHDYSVCSTWAIIEQCFYLIDVFRDRLEHPDLVRCAESYARSFQARAVLIEDSPIGIGLIQSLKRSTSLNVIPLKPDGEKVARATRQTPVVEAGRVFLPAEAPWLATFLHEVLAFPNGRHDDQVDSMVQFLEWAQDRFARAGASGLRIYAATRPSPWVID